MKISYLVLLVCGIIAILSGNYLVLDASATVSDDCCETYDQGENIFEMIYGIRGLVANLSCSYSTSTNGVSWVGPPNFTSAIAARDRVNTNLSRLYKWITESQKEENILQIQNASKAVEGSYRCQVFNKSDMNFCFCLSKSATSLEVENRTTTNDLIGIQNKQLTLKCSVKSGRPKENMTWTTASGEELVRGGPQSLSYFLTPQITDDGKQFICNAYHSPFYAVNISVRLRVFSIPVVQILPVTNNIVQEGDSILRKCDSYSNDPLTNYKWCWLNHTISRNNTLYIQNISRHESGKYVCEAKNRAGVNRSEITVIVQYAPNVSVIRTTATGSNDIMLKCHADGIPNNFTFFRWEHRTLLGQHLRFLETGGTLLLPTVSQTTRYYINGIYSCNVSNGIPKTNGILFQTAQHTLYCEGKPVFMTTNREVQYGRFQQMGTIALTIWSYPKPTKIEIRSAESYNQLPNKKFNSSMTNTKVQDVIYDRTVDINGFEIRIAFYIEKENQFTNYTVRVFNEKDFSDLTIDFKSANRPETPNNLTVVPSKQSITVVWNRNFDGGYPQSFIIQYRPIHSEKWTELLPIIDNQLPRQEAVLQKLLLDTEYDIRIFARNRVNDSDLSKTVRVRTQKPSKLTSVYGIVSVACVAVVVIALLVCRKLGRGNDPFCRSSRTLCKRSVDVQRANDAVNNHPNQIDHRAETQQGQLAFSSDVYCSMADLEAMSIVPKIRDTPFVVQKNALGATIETKRQETKVLNYVEIHFEPKPENSKFVIHGIKDKTNYADIDFLATAKPLPESSSDEDADESDDFMSIDFL